MKKIVTIIILTVLGLALGSFINAFVWRLYKNSSSKRKSKKYSIISGRSMCPNCEHELKTIDLIPVFSWLFLRGKCRYCHKAISSQYPLVELLTTGLFIFSYIYWPLSFNSRGIFLFIVYLILLINLIALAVYDIRWLTLPSKILYPLFGLAALKIIISLIFFNGSADSLLSSILGLVIGGGVFYILFQLSKGQWIGGGDVRLGALLGLYMGSGLDSVLMIFFASVFGIIYAIPQMISGKIGKKTLIPYGPFLILAAIILILFGSSIRSWLNGRGLTF